jgi:hypothetical protein
MTWRPQSQVVTVVSRMLSAAKVTAVHANVFKSMIKVKEAVASLPFLYRIVADKK